MGILLDISEDPETKVRGNLEAPEMVVKDKTRVFISGKWMDIEN